MLSIRYLVAACVIAPQPSLGFPEYSFEIGAEPTATACITFCAMLGIFGLILAGSSSKNKTKGTVANVIADIAAPSTTNATAAAAALQSAAAKKESFAQKSANKIKNCTNKVQSWRSPKKKVGFGGVEVIRFDEDGNEIKGWRKKCTDTAKSWWSSLCGLLSTPLASVSNGENKKDGSQHPVLVSATSPSATAQQSAGSTVTASAHQSVGEQTPTTGAKQHQAAEGATQSSAQQLPAEVASASSTQPPA